VTSSAETSLTQLLNQARAGDPQAAQQVAERVSQQLDHMARGLLARGSAVTLEAGDLVNEAWLKLCRPGESPWSSSGHYFKVAAAAMRTILVDRARRRKADKRGGEAQRLSVDQVDELTLAYESRALDLVALDDLLDQLQGVDDLSARVVELRFFAGLTVQEVSAVTGLALGTVERHWRQARAWLLAHLDPKTHEESV
jgi:RNA polymerase sigma factor (TIGR02999 family)